MKKSSIPEEIINKIKQIIENFDDPLTKKPLKIDDPNINLAFKDNHLNISFEIDPSKIDAYLEIKKKLEENIAKIKDILSVNVILTSEKKSHPEKKVARFLVNSKNIIAIASGKGGVGKSSFATNLALALKELGNRVGLLDADIYGPSIPRMMGVYEKPVANENKKLIPLERYGIKCMSIGFLIDVDTPAIWRGPMVIKALDQMFNGVEWGVLDYLIIDLPPGTGDAHLSLAQESKLTGAIIISTPQEVALADVKKGINMFKKVNVPLIGLVENMSYFLCEKCDTRHEIFSNGGARNQALQSKIPFLGELPIDKNLRINSDNGTPIVFSDPKSEIAKKYFEIAKKI
ncbi:MAG: Iron-sulfur cluster carrier protein [Alphaproteobacteria bacterium MarineAlpha5_Bin9]|nr:MAG: Iron-sulfur cluster carrier protein [Alphaproteobacteria bacterium MarineAlpha5_Bin9]|tara:strand:- start:1667 stop:2704 length:1038 start_codon:yes stop_codon:yes gene_type:complete